MTTPDQENPASTTSQGPQLRLRQTVLDAGDHRALAEFYRRLLAAQYAPGSEPGQAEEPRFIELTAPDSGVGLAFQLSATHQAPDWPDQQRVPAQAHIDIDVPPGQLDHAIEYARSLGAHILSTAERAEGGVVLADPAGHPFCLLETG